MTQQITLITTCTKKKIATAYAYLRNDAHFETITELAESWNKLLKSCPEHKMLPASEMYRGRGFRRAVATVGTTNVGILSAGLGLIAAEDSIVPYNLTTSVGSPNHVKNHVNGRFDPVEWWSLLCKSNSMSLNKLITANPDSLFIIACSRAYLEMLNEDLLSLSQDERKNIRIVGNDLEQASDFELFDYIMPYDLRLNALTNYGGGKIDFAQRSAAHLINEIIKPADSTLNAKDHQKLVFKSMEAIGSIDDVRKSESITNEDLRGLLLTEWENGFGKSTRLLQIVRKKHGFSCSESRLTQVFQEIRDDLSKGIDVFQEHQEEQEAEAA